MDLKDFSQSLPRKVGSLPPTNHSMHTITHLYMKLAHDRHGFACIDVQHHTGFVRGQLWEE